MVAKVTEFKGHKVITLVNYPSLTEGACLVRGIARVD